MKSQLNTQEAEALLKKGWILKHNRDSFFHHGVWIKHPTYDGPGCAKYLSHGVYNNLISKGYKSVEHILKKQ